MEKLIKVDIMILKEKNNKILFKSTNPTEFGAGKVIKKDDTYLYFNSFKMFWKLEDALSYYNFD